MLHAVLMHTSLYLCVFTGQQLLDPSHLETLKHLCLSLLRGDTSIFLCLDAMNTSHCVKLRYIQVSDERREMCVEIHVYVALIIIFFIVRLSGTR